MSTPVCNPCAPGRECLDNLDRYSLQDDVYYFVLNCPAGMFCGGNNVMYLVCCDGTTLQETFPAGITTAQRNALISRLIGRCMIAEAFCDDDGGENDDEGTDTENPLQLYGNHPRGASANCPDGLPFTYTVPAGLFYAKTQVQADAAAYAYARSQAIARRICLSAPTRFACIDTPYSSTIVASGGTGQFNWNVAGSLPAGMTAVPIGQNGLRISGIPTTAGVYSFTVRGVDHLGAYMDKPTSITVWGITDTALPDASVGVDYNHQLSVSGGTSPFTFTVVSGTFPIGIDMAGDGLITGTTLDEGDFTINVRVTDAANRSCTKDLTLEVEGCPSPQVVTFTVPVPGKEYGISQWEYASFAVIASEQKTVIGGSDLNLGCLDIINYVGVPFRESRFLMNAQTGWRANGQVYDPVSGLIVAIVSNGVNPDNVAFFHPTTGYVSKVELATTSPPLGGGLRAWLGILMRGSPNMVAFFRSSVQNNNPGYIYIFNTDTRTIENYFVLPPAALRIYGRGDFSYGCARNEFYFTGTESPAQYRVFVISADDGSTVASYPTSFTEGVVYVDGLNRLFILGSSDRVRLMNPSDGSLDLSVFLTDQGLFPYIQGDQPPVFNFKLNRVMISATWDELPDPPYNESSGLLLIRASDLQITHYSKAYSSYQTGGHGRFDEDLGDIYWQFAPGTEPIKQIRPTIT